MATLFTELYEGGSSGNNVTTGTSSYTTLSASSKFTFSNAQAHNGSLSGKVDIAADTHTARWEWSPTALVWFRRYLYVPALPATDSVIGVVYNGTTVVARLKLLATGQLRVDDGTTAAATTSASIATGAWVRVAWKVDPGTTSGGSSQVLRLYQGANLEAGAGTYTEQLSTTAYRAGQTTVDELRVGLTVSGTITYYVDDDLLDDASEPGPTGTGGGGDIILAVPTMTATASLPGGDVVDEFVFTPPSFRATAAFIGEDTGVTITAAAGDITIRVPSMVAFAQVDEPTVDVPFVWQQYPAALMQPRVDVAFTSWADEPVWTDISRWVNQREGVSITRGRSQETEQPDTGSMSLVLDNSDGRFSPDYQGSPYYPGVKLGRRIRCQVVSTAKNWVVDPSFAAWSWPWWSDLSGLGYTAAASLERVSALDTGGLAAARAKLADVDTAAFNVVVIGDSIGEGMAATAVGNRWVDKLQARLRADFPVSGVDEVEQTYVPAFYGMAETGWLAWNSPTRAGDATTYDDFGLGARSVKLSDSGGAGSITFSVTGKVVELHYLKSDFSAAEFTVTIDGGSPTTLDAYDAGAAGGVAAKWTSGTLSDATHSVVVAWSARSGNSAFILGCKAYDDDSGKSIHVWDGSQGGYTADLHRTKNQTQLAQVVPDLVCIALGFNDAGGTYSPALFRSKIGDLIDVVRAQAADVPVLIVGYYNSKAAEAGWLYPDWSQYIQAMSDAAGDRDYCEFLDLSAVMPDTWADPSWYGDSVHPNDAGHAWIAELVADRIESSASTAAKATWAAATTDTAVGTNVYGLRLGETYTASAYVYVPTGSPDVALHVPFIAAGTATSTKDAWTRITCTFTATATFHLLAVVADTADAGDVVYVDDVQVELGAAATDFDAVGATIADRFNGTVTSWPMAWPGNVATYSEARVTASDGLRQLSALGELRSMLEEEHRLLEPIGYWPMEEDGAAVTGGGDISATPLTMAQVGTEGSVEYGADLVPVAGVTGAWFVPADSTNGKYLYGAVRYYDPVTTGWSVSCLFTGSTTERTLLYIPASAGYLRVGTDSAGMLEAQWVVGSARFSLNNGEALSGITAGEPHHVVVTGENMGSGNWTIRFYLDGFREVLYAGAAGPELRPTGRIGVAIGGLDSLPLWSGKVGHVAVWDRTLDDGEILRLSGCRTGWHGDTTSERVNRVADWLLIPDADRDIGESMATLSAQATRGRTALDVLQDAERAENGVVFAGRDGRLVHRGRGARYEAQVAYDVESINLDGAPVLALDDVMLQAAGNDVTVTRPGGASQRAVNQTSVDEYGPYRQQIDMPAGDDTQALAAANWRVNTFGEPQVRCVQVEANLTTTLGETLRSQFLETDIGTRLRVVDLPESTAPTETLDLFVEGYSERIGLDSWPLSFTTSPAPQWPVWVLEDPANGVLERTTRLAY